MGKIIERVTPRSATVIVKRASAVAAVVQALALVGRAVVGLVQSLPALTRAAPETPTYRAVVPSNIATARRAVWVGVFIAMTAIMTALATLDAPFTAISFAVISLYGAYAATIAAFVLRREREGYATFSFGAWLSEYDPTQEILAAFRPIPEMHNA